VTGDWRDFRPVIWLTMIALALALLVSPAYIAAFPLGAAIGVSLRIRQRRARRLRAGKRS